MLQVITNGDFFLRVEDIDKLGIGRQLVAALRESHAALFDWHIDQRHPDRGRLRRRLHGPKGGVHVVIGDAPARLLV